MTIRGNNSLMINPIAVNPISSETPFRRWSGIVYSSGSWSPAIFESNWSIAVARYLSASWVQTGTVSPSFYGGISDSPWPYVFVARYKQVFRFDLSEEAVGYAPNLIQKACMRYSVRNWNNIPNTSVNVAACVFKGSVNNITTGETGIFKELSNGYSIINFRSIPLSDFGNSAKDYSLEPSLNENNPEEVKPTYVEALRKASFTGLYAVSSNPQILFMPKIL